MISEEQLQNFEGMAKELLYDGSLLKPVVYHLIAEVRGLEKEASWLERILMTWCIKSCCDYTCPYMSEGIECPFEDRENKNWREAARKAVSDEE